MAFQTNLDSCEKTRTCWSTVGTEELTKGVLGSVGAVVERAGRPPHPPPPHTLIHTPTCLVEMPWSGTSADSLWFRAGFSHFLSSHEPITFVAHSDESFISSRSGSVLCVCVFTFTVFILFLEGERERERERERACVRACVCNSRCLKSSLISIWNVLLCLLSPTDSILHVDNNIVLSRTEFVASLPGSPVVTL